MDDDTPQSEAEYLGISAEHLSRAYHDLSAPLRRVQLLAGLLLEDPDEPLPSEACSELRRMDLEAGHAAAMVDGLMNIARLQHAPLKRETVELSELVEAAAAEVQATQLGKSLAVACQPGLRVEGDRALLLQMFVELLDNAVRHAGDARVKVTLGPADADAADATSPLCVSDDGPGIESERARKEALVTFVRLGAAGADRYRPGVGLTIAKVIARRHGADLWLEQSSAGGTRVCIGLATTAHAESLASIVVPLMTTTPPRESVGNHDGASLSPSRLPFSSQPVGGRVRVLLVEDSEADFHLVAQMLRAASGDYELDWVRSAAAGLEAMVQNRHELYVLDHHLSPGSGVDVVKQAASGGWYGPAILLTGEDPKLVAMDAVRAGFSDFVSKDEISSARLERTMQYCLERHRRSMELASLAYVDGLTGLLNPRGLKVSARPILERAARSAECLSVLVLDLNGFKEVNDVHGHAAGNAVLREVGKRLHGRLRGSDLVARTGGDEFVVVLSNQSSREDAARVAADLVAAIQVPIVCHRAAMLQVGTSIGRADFPADGTTLDMLIECADAAMYEHKRELKAVTIREG